MTALRVIEGGRGEPPAGPLGPDERVTPVLDRVAGELWHEHWDSEDHFTWADMIAAAASDAAAAAQVRSYRTTARVALSALRPSDAPYDADIEAAIGAHATRKYLASPSRLLLGVQSYIDEVLS